MAIEDKNRASRQNNFTTMSAIKSYADDMLVNKKYEGEISNFVESGSTKKYFKIFKFKSGLSYKLDIEFRNGYMGFLAENACSLGSIEINSTIYSTRSGLKHMVYAISSNERIKNQFRLIDTFDNNLNENYIYLEYLAPLGSNTIKYKINCISDINFGDTRPYEVLEFEQSSYESNITIHKLKNPWNWEDSEYPEDALVLDSLNGKNLKNSSEATNFILEGKNLVISNNQTINNAFLNASSTLDKLKIYSSNDTDSYNVYADTQIPENTLTLIWSEGDAINYISKNVSESLDKGDFITFYVFDDGNGGLNSNYIITRNSNKISGYETINNKINEWPANLNDDQYPTAKLVKESISDRRIAFYDNANKKFAQFTLNQDHDQDIVVPFPDVIDNLESNETKKSFIG